MKKISIKHRQKPQKIRNYQSAVPGTLAKTASAILKDVKKARAAAPDRPIHLWPTDPVQVFPGTWHEHSLVHEVTLENTLAAEIARYLRVAINGDDTARDFIVEQLGIECDDIAGSLATVATVSPEAVVLLLAGQLGSGLRLLQAVTGSGAEGCAEIDVHEIGSAMARFNLARDLETKAMSCRDELFRPTGLPWFDDTDRGGLPQIQGVGTRWCDDHDDAMAIREIALTGRGMSDEELRNTRIGRRLASFELLAQPWLRRRQRSDDVAAIVRDSARLLTGFSRSVAMYRPQAETWRLPKFKSQAVANMRAVRPLVEFHAAVQQAVAWIGLPISDHSRGDGHVDMVVPVDEAVRAFLRHEAIVVPNFDKTVPPGWSNPLMPRCHKEKARTRDLLVFAYRAGTIRDPDHLPTAARNVTGRDGRMVRVRTAVEAARVRGTAYTTRELFELAAAAQDDDNDPYLDSGLTARVNKARAAYYRDPTPEQIASVKRQIGLLEWRFTI